MSCRLTPPASGPARAIAAAGWMPFNYFGQPITQDNVEIVGGVTGADGMCRPTQFNVFVFVAGRFAGTLSPALMTSREDGSSARSTTNNLARLPDEASGKSWRTLTEAPAASGERRA